MTHLRRPATRHIRNGMIAGLLSLSSALALTPAAHAASGQDGAVEIVNDAVDRTMVALEDSTISESEASNIADLVAIDRVAKFALGKTWETISADQQERYVDAFHVYAKQQLQEHLSGLSKAEVEVADVETRGNGDAIVMTNVKTAEDPMQKLNWRVIKADGEWGIVDIQAQDVWFAIEQRAQFDAILDKNNGDIEALITELKS
ncbi:MlaC/ttg2D family ABC transporter substrate-binding protein [Henriciella aquimarina]|uniref:MlaC/ttg2D family ABC transporter substrate-binding protein n=1 Tax=Henriciella aquimarina TaxID=545261 RepID=UPI0009FF0FA3|nr:ABC transporter substrate-binding protein [Henriciella aquimarina]